MPHYQPDLVGILKRVNDSYLASITAAEMTRQSAIATAQATYGASVLNGCGSCNANLAAALAAADQARAEAGRTATALRERLAELVRRAPDILSGAQTNGGQFPNWATASEALEAIRTYISDLAAYVGDADIRAVN